MADIFTLKPSAGKKVNFHELSRFETKSHLTLFPEVLLPSFFKALDGA